MRRTIDELVTQAGQKLTESGYKPSTIQRYKASWNKARRWCWERGIEHFGAEQEHQLLEGMGLLDERLSPGGRHRLRHIRTLRSVDENGALPPWSRPAAENVPQRFQQVFAAYISHLEQRGLSCATQRGQTSVIRKFMMGLSIDRFSALSVSDIALHMEACSWMTAQTRAVMLYIIRAFAKWAASEGLCSPGVAAAMPVIPGHKHAALPSAYAVSEVAAVVAAPGEECPKRDRAMLLLSSILGLRAGELRGLCLGDIDWRGREVSITQSKTGHHLRLPLPEEVMLAVADYLRNERPQSPDEHVFLHHRAPHASFEETSNSFHHVATGAYARALVNTAGKHHGMHSLRHSAATNLLSGGTAYPVISGILGHSNANTTRRYMAIDVENLRRLCLEVPRG